MSDRQSISEQGRAALAAAVSVDWDWALPFSSVDHFLAALDVLDDGELEAVGLLAYSLREAATCLLLRRGPRLQTEGPQNG